MAAPLRIIVKPTGSNGRYSARLGERLLLASARCPLLESARLLLAEGVAPETVLEMQHSGSPIVAMRGRLGELAALTVVENKNEGPVFRKFVPFDRPFGEDSVLPRSPQPVGADFEPRGGDIAETAEPRPTRCPDSEYEHAQGHVEQQPSN
jgi:hypothetical protein